MVYFFYFFINGFKLIFDIMNFIDLSDIFVPGGVD